MREVLNEICHRIDRESIRECVYKISAKSASRKVVATHFYSVEGIAIESKLERMQIGNRDILREEPLLVELEHPEFSTEDELVADEAIIIEPDV